MHETGLAWGTWAIKRYQSTSVHANAMRSHKKNLKASASQSQSMCRRTEEVDEASPRRRRNQKSLHVRGVRGQVHYVEVVKPCSPNKKEVRARRNLGGRWGRGEEAEASYAKYAGVAKRSGVSARVRAGAGTLASVRVPPPGGGSRLGNFVFFSRQLELELGGGVSYALNARRRSAMRRHQRPTAA